MNISEAIKEAWSKACEHEGVTPTAKFVAFSPDNPHLSRLNKLTSIYQNYQNALRRQARFN